MPKLRRATLDDLTTLVAHRRGMFRDMGGYANAELDAADPVYRRWLRQRMRSGNAVCWIVEERGEPASSGKGPPGGRAPEDRPRRNEAAASGCVWLKGAQPRPGAPEGIVPYLMSMYTEPTHRGKGHATRIVKAGLAWCKTQGHPKMELHASKAGRPIYEKLGFEATTEMRKML